MTDTIPSNNAFHVRHDDTKKKFCQFLNLTHITHASSSQYLHLDDASPIMIVVLTPASEDHSLFKMFLLLTKHGAESNRLNTTESTHSTDKHLAQSRFLPAELSLSTTSRAG